MKLLPQVKSFISKSGDFLLDETTQISIKSYQKEIYDTAVFLSGHLESVTGKKFPVIFNDNGDCKSIQLEFKNGNTSCESYCINCTPTSIRISAYSLRGVFYGVQTLIQVISLHMDKIPCFDIIDSPDFDHRGFYHDVTRGKVPTLGTLKKLVEKLAHYKINELQLYIEHAFNFREIPELWIDKDPLTHAEIIELDQYCKKFHIDLIPSLATFGHLYELLRLRRFEHLNELDVKASEVPHNLWDRMAHYTIDPLNDESLKIVVMMIEEFIPLFSSKYFNICCDETFDLGKGKNLLVAQEKGTGRLYVDFLKKILQIVIKHNKIPMFWGDIVLHYPELINEIPSNAIFLNWAYGADVSEDATATFYNAGVNQYVCPGVTGWSRFANDINGASKNIRSMIQYGKKYHASGVLNTDWGDCGHVNFLSSSYHGLILGASLAWNSGSYASDTEFDSAVSRIEYKDPSEKIASGLRELGSLCFYHFGNFYGWIKNIDCMWNKEATLKETPIVVLTENYLKAKSIYNELVLLRATLNIPEIDYREILCSAFAIKWSLAVLIYKKAKEFAQESDVVFDRESLLQQGVTLCQEFTCCWRIRNKESELANVVETFKAIFEKLTEIEHLHS
jgi:hypothetical protein